MKLLAIISNDTANVDAILQCLIQTGIRGATVVEGSGVGRSPVGDVPLFGGLRQAFDTTRGPNSVIFSIISDEQVLKDAADKLKDELDFLQAGGGIMFTLPVSWVWGGAEENRPEESG